MAAIFGPDDVNSLIRTFVNIGKYTYKAGEFVYKINERENKRTKKRKQIEKDKSELQKIGLGDIDSVQMAMRQGHITYDNYKEIMAILES